MGNWHPDYACLGRCEGEEYNSAEDVGDKSVYIFDISEVTVLDVGLVFEFLNDYRPELCSKTDVVMIYRPYRLFGKKSLSGHAYQTGRVGIIKIVLPSLRSRRRMRREGFNDFYLLYVFAGVWHELEHLRGNHGVFPSEKDEREYLAFLSSRRDGLSGEGEKE